MDTIKESLTDTLMEHHSLKKINSQLEAELNEEVGFVFVLLPKRDQDVLFTTDCPPAQQPYLLEANCKQCTETVHCCGLVQCEGIQRRCASKESLN